MGKLSASCVFTLAVGLFAAPGASAQAPSPAPKAADPPSSTAGWSTVAAAPAPPEADDPMLAPVPRPARILTSWRDAAALLRARSTDLRIAFAQALQAEANTRTAIAAYLPTITANGRYNHEFIRKDVPEGAIVVVAGGVATVARVAPLANTLAGNVQLQQSILDVQALDQISIDELGEDVGRLSVADQKRTLVLSVANQIATVVTAERTAEINRVGLKVALEQFEITSRTHGLGAGTVIDVVRAEQNAANARAALVAGDEALRVAREALGLALGVPEETGVSPELNVDGLAEDAMTSCRPVSTVDERPDVAVAQTQLEVAKRNLRNVWYGFLPTVTALSSVNATSNIPNGYPNPTWSASGLLTIPIWDGGARYGAIRNARAAEDIASEELEAVRQRSLIQVEQATRELSVAAAADKVARLQRDLAARNEALNQTAYKAGEATSLEMVTASEAHRSAEIELALKDFGVIRAKLLADLALATCTL
jgi:outer membrane protein TolC